MRTLNTLIAATLVLSSYAMAETKTITEEEAKKIALTKVAGTVTEVERENEKGQDVYSVEIMKDGKKFEVHIDPVSGKVLAVEDDAVPETK